MNRSHIGDIIKFTVVENLKKKSILVTTILVALVCALVLPVIVLVSQCDSESDKDKEFKIQKVYILDATGWDNVGYETLPSMSKDYKDMEVSVQYAKTNGDKTDSDKSKSKKINDKQVIGAIVRLDQKKNITIDISISKDSKIKESAATELGYYIEQLLTMKKYQLAAKDDGELLELMAGVNVTVNTIGKGKDNEIFSLMKIYVPAIFSFIIYFMLLTYGQSLSNGMVTEKNSKIIELLVAHIKPRYLIIGKVLGCVIVAVGQLLIWALAILLGIKSANVISENLTDKVFINTDAIIEMIRNANMDSAFSITAIILAVVLVLLGFLFYCIYAAICGSFINKPDEASSVFAVYTYTNVVAFLVVYMGAFLEKKEMIGAARYIPFSAPYIVPADIILGNISVSQALIICGIMLVCIVVIIKLLGSIYEKLVFNQLSLKELIKSKSQ